MAIKSKTVTISGDDVVLTSVTLFPQPDGSCGVVFAGNTVDSEGRTVTLKETRMMSAPRANPPIDVILGSALQALRKANDLEDEVSLVGDLTNDDILTASAKAQAAAIAAAEAAALEVKP